MPKREPEYTLNVFHRTDDRTGGSHFVFLVQTTKIFVSFRYEILLEEELKGKTIHLRLVGLHAPALLMPGTGPAIGLRTFDSLAGTYTVVVTKQDKSVNTGTVTISGTAVTCTSREQHPFILMSSDPVAID